MTIYHLWCGTVVKDLAADRIRWTGFAFRIWNEVATLFLVAIVFLVVLKDGLDLLKGLAGLIVFAALLMAGIRIYKRVRENG